MLAQPPRTMLTQCYFILQFSLKSNNNDRNDDPMIPIHLSYHFTNRQHVVQVIRYSNQTIFNVETRTSDRTVLASNFYMYENALTMKWMMPMPMSSPEQR
ncbi:unnamed protein product [Albugo candida]|uniref:Uncharacterized protein n=1 Tax=Albugo candida TaxID=65357 RepID=A0A024FYA5_9STRA|nr:unnamed protein product [Albugo candida]|eukprot:CCI11654.1 unnamed protein product [Albugo candida]